MHSICGDGNVVQCCQWLQAVHQVTAGVCCTAQPPGMHSASTKYADCSYQLVLANMLQSSILNSRHSRINASINTYHIIYIYYNGAMNLHASVSVYVTFNNVSMSMAVTADRVFAIYSNMALCHGLMPQARWRDWIKWKLKTFSTSN